MKEDSLCESLKSSSALSIASLAPAVSEAQDLVDALFILIVPLTSVFLLDSTSCFEAVLTGGGVERLLARPFNSRGSGSGVGDVGMVA